MRRAFSKAACRLGVMVLAIGGVALVAPSLASAAPTCGSTVTHNVTLHATLDCSGSNSDGLIVGADGITINLNGFSIVSDNSNCWNGIDNFAGFDNVTVENGTLANWGCEGLYYDSATGGKVQNVLSRNNSGEGIEVENSTNTAITGDTTRYNGDDGVYLSDNHQVNVTSSASNHNSGAGITDHNSFSTLNGNKTNNNSQWGVFVYEPLRSGSSMYLIENSKANFNGDSGFKIDDNTPTTTFQAKVVGNTATNNGTNNYVPDGWGFYADASVVSNTTNGAKNNLSGNCFHVKCHAL